MSRNEKDTTKPANMDTTSSTVNTTAKTSKFKYNAKPTPQLRLDTFVDENRTVNTMQSKPNLAAPKKSMDCVVISDEESFSSPVKSVTTHETDDDIFANFKTPDLNFVTASKLAKNDVTTMDDLYTKYGTPESKAKKSLDSFDIDKELSSNPSYTTAMKRLEENMEQIRSSPKKSGISKFKFNTRSKPATATATAIASNQSTAQTSYSNSTNFNSNFSSSNTSVSSEKTSTVTAKSIANVVDRFSTANLSPTETRSANSSRFNPYKPATITSASTSNGSFKPPAFTPTTLSGESTKSADNSP